MSNIYKSPQMLALSALEDDAALDMFHWEQLLFVHMVLNADEYGLVQVNV